MAIKVTTTVQTSEGATDSLYFHIDVVVVQKKDGSQVVYAVKYYTDPTKETPCQIFEGVLKNAYILDVSDTLNDDNIKKVGYDKIGAELKAAGLAPESDETGSWVAY